jgi:hypothetical protein
VGTPSAACRLASLSALRAAATTDHPSAAAAATIPWPTSPVAPTTSRRLATSNLQSALLQRFSTAFVTSSAVVISATIRSWFSTIVRWVSGSDPAMQSRG